jgi:hypothetical protein
MPFKLHKTQALQQINMMENVSPKYHFVSLPIARMISQFYVSSQQAPFAKAKVVLTSSKWTTPSRKTPETKLAPEKKPFSTQVIGRMSRTEHLPAPE